MCLYVIFLIRSLVAVNNSLVTMADSSDSCVQSDRVGLGSHYPSTTNPTEVKDYNIHAFPPGIGYRDYKHLQQVAQGKWMIFRPYTELDETWHMIRREVEAGVLVEKSLAADCTTMVYDPTSHGPGPVVSGVICVYSTEQNADDVGFILISLAKHDIKYKTEEATNNLKYAWRLQDKSVCLKTLYWNHGKPSFVLEGELCNGPSRYGIKDTWHLNYVSAPKSIMSTASVYGRWVIAPFWEDLTSLWHFLKKDIEEGLLGPVEMVCPPKLNRRDKKEEPVFLVYTARENKESVGLTLAMHVERDIRYEISNRSYTASGGKPMYNHQITWHEDEPVYVMTLIK